jgi:Ca2+-binding EF-hand superfamily protein
MANCVAVEGFDKELECSVCMDSFRDAVELKPCGHVFCKQCAAQLASCAMCRKNITDRPAANLLIRNMALKVPVKCEGCQWIGSREQSLRHRCGDPVPPAAATAARPQVPPAATPAKQPSSHVPPALPPGQKQPVLTGQFPQQGYYPPQQQMQQQQGYYPAYPQQQQSGYYPPYPQHPQGQYPGYPPMQHQQQAYYPAYPQPQQGHYPGYPPPHHPPGGYPQAYPPQPGYPPQPPSFASGPGPLPVPITVSAQPVQHEHQPPLQGPPPLIEIPDRDPWLAYGMTMDEYDQMMVIFMTFDTDGSGALDKHEVTVMARFLNYARTQPEIDRMFAVMDRDRSGTLSLAELLTWMKYNRPDPQALYGLPQSKYHEVLFQFHQFDGNSDGLLNEREFAQLCKAMRYAETDAAAKAFFASIDLNRSGTVDIHEFLLFRRTASMAPR